MRLDLQTWQSSYSRRPASFWPLSAYLIVTLYAQGCAQAPSRSLDSDVGDEAIDEPNTDDDDDEAEPSDDESEPDPSGTRDAAVRRDATTPGGSANRDSGATAPRADASTGPGGARPDAGASGPADSGSRAPVDSGASGPSTPTDSGAASDASARPDTSVAADSGGPAPSDAGSSAPSGRCASAPAYATTDACSQCICAQCPTEVASCYASSDATKNQQCGEIRTCSEANQCASTDCYCGAALLCSVDPQGVCRDVIQSVAGSTSGIAILAASGDPESPIGRANAVGQCSQVSCAAECGL